MEKSTKKIFLEVKAYLIITLGLLCYTLAWSVFIIPNNMVGGGVTGISAIIQYCTGFEVSYSYFIINTILLLFSLKVLGKGFGVKTVFAIIVTSILFKIVPTSIPESFINEIAIQNGKLLCSIFGGALSGLGVALTFTQGGSSGGTDIIALMINKYRTISPGKILVFLDMFIIASSLIIPSEGNWGHKLATMIYGYIMAGVFSFTMDVFLNGNRQSVQILIFSKKYNQIADRITKEARRGATVINAQGWYTKEEGKVVMVIVRKNESNLIFRIVKEVDNTAFLSVGNVMGVYGKGFEQIKK
ncbi:MAG: YitT family protein [Bacteroidales bacterium]|nr:YitT family protein [Bacteroidales bacterium]